jgi:hypothetical protein
MAKTEHAQNTSFSTIHMQQSTCNQNVSDFFCNPDPCSQQHVHDTLATQQCWGWLAGWAA